MGQVINMWQAATKLKKIRNQKTKTQKQILLQNITQLIELLPDGDSMHEILPYANKLKKYIME